MIDKYAIVGNPVAHSLSPHIHKLFAKQSGCNIAYKAIRANSISEFKQTIEQLREEGYKGCNVTAPFKRNAFMLSDIVSYAARSADAVNTITFDGDKIIGENTDGDGFVADVENILRDGTGVDVFKDKRVLIVGTGGASRAIVSLLITKGLDPVIVSRNTNRAVDMAEEFYPSVGCGFDDLGSTQFDIVINATPTGWSDDELPLPSTVFSGWALAYDLAYGKETPFMAFARKNGVTRVSDGLGMLVEQAAETFVLWREVERPDTKKVITELRKGI